MHQKVECSTPRGLFYLLVGELGISTKAIENQVIVGFHKPPNRAS